MLKDIYERIIIKENQKIANQYPCINREDIKYIEFVTKIINGEYVHVELKPSKECNNPDKFFKKFSNGYINVKDKIVELGINKPEKLEELLKDEMEFIQPGTLRLS